jgi:hypothetical protein
MLDALTGDKDKSTGSEQGESATAIGRRAPEFLMQLHRLGAFHQTRLSFMRILTRRLQQERWQFHKAEFQIDDRGVGYAVYTISGPRRAYSLIAFSHDIPDEKRSDRVIAEVWDATFTLVDGVPTKQDVNRLAQQVPRQEAGRLTQTELALSRANRSVRLWEHVVDSLAHGRQPDWQQVMQVGYLMRTTAVYGSGKFGLADRQAIASRSEFAEPFQVEMLCVYLIRSFVRDLVQHMASQRSSRLGLGESAVLDEVTARALGIGNSTGLGMAPFLINHPRLFNNWIMVREEALSRVLNLDSCNDDARAIFVDLLEASHRCVARWHTEHSLQSQKIAALRNDLYRLQTQFQAMDLTETQPWANLYQWASGNLCTEAQEYLVSLILEPYPELVDDLACCLSDSTDLCQSVDGNTPIKTIKQQIETAYSWALSVNWQDSASIARVWYVSEEKLEPRLGERFEEMLEPFEQPLAPGREVATMYRELAAFDGNASIAEFLLRYPQFRQAVSRVQLLSDFPYAEIRDNTISAELIPFDMLRCKLSFFGATQFDPRSDRWLRIILYANAPYPEELAQIDADRWVYS